MLYQSQQKTVIKKASLVLLGSLGLQSAHADFMGDANTSINLRNFYIERDYSYETSSNIGSWTQAITGRFESGYTDTPIQIGLDLIGQYALRLSDHNEGRADNIIPFDYAEGEQERGYGKVGAALKLKYRNSDLRIGELEPKLPSVFFDDSRQLLTIYSGVLFQTREIKDLTFTAGHINRINARNDDRYRKLSLHTGSATNAYESDGLNFVGLDYKITPSVFASYWFGQLQDIYQQHYVNLAYSTQIGDTRVKFDGRYFDNSEDGDAYYGDIENQSYGFMTTIATGNHSFLTGVRKNEGKSGFPTLAGLAPQPYLHAWSLLGFVSANELTWHLQYGFNFKDVGIPGLTTTLRYLHGSEIHREGLYDNTEIEKSIALKYVVPQGRFKNLGVELIHFDVETKYGSGGNHKGNDFKENRLVTTYTFKF